MGRSGLRWSAILVLAGVVIAALAALHHRPALPPLFASASAPAPDDLSAALRQCRAPGPRGAEEAYCQVVWEENRRRFFGRPARPLPPRAAPANSSEGAAR